jgi:FNIP Repeat
MNFTTGRDFNQPIDQLPPTLTHLTTSHYFNKPVDQLPPTLTHLTLEQDFNQPVDKLPPKLTSSLALGSITQLTISHQHSHT